MIVKKVFRIISYVLLWLIALLALVFVFVEFRSLIAGDYQLMNSPRMAFVTTLFRGLFYLTIVVFAVHLFFYFLTKKELVFSHYSVSITILLSSILTLFFYTNGIFYIPMVISGLLCLIVIFRGFVI